MTDFGNDKDFPQRKASSSKPFQPLNVSKGEKGDSAIYLFMDPPSLAIPCDNDGDNPVLTLAETTVRIMKFGSALTGWTITIASTSNCTASVSAGNIVSIDSVSGSLGHVQVKATKEGMPDMYAYVYFYKAFKGAKGDQGDAGTGSTGAQGPQGEKGEDGTGLVTKVFTITNQEGYITTASITDDSGAKITLTDHGFVVGQVIEIENTDGPTDYDGEWTVSEVIDSNSFRVSGMTYTIDLSGFKLWDRRKILRVSGDSSRSQDLLFPGIIPENCIPVEIGLVVVDPAERDFSIHEFYVYLGNTRYPDSSYNLFMNGNTLQDARDQKKYFFSPKKLLVDAGSADRNVYLRITRYSGKNWYDDYETLKAAMYVSYRTYDIPASS